MYEKEIKEYLERHGFGTFSPKAVLFDMDGVLYDSMPNHAYSWHKSMDALGITMPPEDAYKYEGMRGVETIKLLARQQWGRELTDEEAQRMYGEKSRIYSECPVAKVMDGVQDLQRKMKADGMKIVVVTGSGQRSLLDKLVKDFDGLVSPELIVSSFDVSRGKPDPEPYLKGMAKAGVKPWEAIVVENAPLGVRAGVAAGVFTIAVNTGPLPDSMLTDEGAAVVFSRMADFSDSWETIKANFQ
ncbi:MAG: HAD-IA family hydrolase [Prevotella sp.]|nr:HAD-IA family hydrolase [Prevotella sp.]MDO4933956.1 HAD-IA family hydrolase [Prevotella sp.]